MSDALFAALRADDVDALDAALAAYAHADDARDRYDRTALYVAVKTGRPACVRRLVQVGADPTRVDPRRQSALDAALEEGDPTLFVVMAEAGKSLPALSLSRRIARAAACPKLATWILAPGDAPPPPSPEEKELAEEWGESTLPERVTASLLHALVDAHNWDSHNELVVRVVRHPLCTPLTARLAYDRGALADFDREEPVPAWQRADVKWQADLLDALEARFADVISVR